MIRLKITVWLCLGLASIWVGCWVNGLLPIYSWAEFPVAVTGFIATIVCLIKALSEWIKLL